MPPEKESAGNLPYSLLGCQSSKIPLIQGERRVYAATLYKSGCVDLASKSRGIFQLLSPAGERKIKFLPLEIHVQFPDSQEIISTDFRIIKNPRFDTP